MRSRGLYESKISKLLKEGVASMEPSSNGVFVSDSIAIFYNQAIVQGEMREYLFALYPNARRPLGTYIYSIETIAIRAFYKDYVVIYNVPRYLVRNYFYPVPPMEWTKQASRIIQYMDLHRISETINRTAKEA